MELSKRTISGLPIRIAVRLLGVSVYYFSMNMNLLFSMFETSHSEPWSVCTKPFDGSVEVIQCNALQYS